MTAALDAALRQRVITPRVRLELTRGAQSFSFDQSRVLAAEETREPYRHAAEFLLHNADGALNATDLRGFRAIIGWGAQTATGAEYVYSPPLTVMRHETISEPGLLACRLLCHGLPEGLAEDRASGAYRPDSGSTETVKTLIEQVLSAALPCYGHCAATPYAWDGTDALATSYRPRDGFRVYLNGSRLAAVRRLLDFTTCAMRVEPDGKLRLFPVAAAGGAVAHEFSLASGGHAFLRRSGGRTLVLPNRVIVRTPEDWPVMYTGVATDTESYALLPRVQHQVAAADSTAQATLLAQAILSKYVLQAPAATLTVPLAPQVQVLDRVRVTDERQGDAVTGNVGLLCHRWSAGRNGAPPRWETRLELGGWTSVRELANRLEVYPTPQGYERLGRLSVKDLEAENIRAGNIRLEWLKETGAVDLSRIGDTLDHLNDGATYARMRSTNISAGNILLSSAVQVKTGANSDWYDVGYVNIDADVGITISGQDLVFAYGSQRHYIYPSSSELDIMSASGCDIHFLNGPVKLSCHMDPKSDDTYDLGYSSRRYGAVYCHDLYVSNKPWDDVDDLALVRAIRPDAKDGSRFDGTSLPPMLKPGYKREEKLRRREQQLDRDDDEVRAMLDQALTQEKRPEKRAELQAARAEVGKDRQQRLDRYAESLDDDRCLSVGDSVALLFGAVRQLADLVDEVRKGVRGNERE